MCSSNRKYNNLLLILIVLSIPHLTIKANSPTLKATTPHNQELQLWDALVDHAQQQLEAIHGILSDLSAIVNEKQTNIKNKDVVLDNIKRMMRDVENKKNLLAVNTNKDELYFTTQFTQHAITHIVQALEKNLQTFARFTFEQKVTRNQKEIAPTDVEYNIRTSHKALNKLKSKANNAGLFWYNKIYRTLDKYALRYVAAYGKNTLCAVATASYLWWHLGENTWLETFLGVPYTPKMFHEAPAPQNNQGANNQGADNQGVNHQEQANRHIPSGLGKIEAFIAAWNKELLPLGPALLWMYGEDLNEKWTYEIKPAIEKKVKALH